MKNTDRIRELCLAKNIYTEEEIKKFISDEGELPLHTKSKWLEKGKTPRKDAEGYITKLWKKENDTNKYYLVNATLYSETMVEDM